MVLDSCREETGKTLEGEEVVVVVAAVGIGSHHPIMSSHPLTTIREEATKADFREAVGGEVEEMEAGEGEGIVSTVSRFTTSCWSILPFWWR